MSGEMNGMNGVVRVKRKGSKTDWLVLRTAPSRTLRLAQALKEADFAVWTPQEAQVRRLPRQKAIGEVAVPLLGGFVFAPADRKNELLTMARSPALTYQTWDSEARRFVTRGYPFFTVVFQDGEAVGLRDRDLNGLREVEERLRALADKRREAARQKGPPPKFDAGDIVRVGGSFEGLDLVVAQANTGKLVKVTLPGWTMAVDMSAWDLQILGGSSNQDAA
jgi:hypothetical protein